MIAFHRLALAAIGLASAITAWMPPAFAQSNSSAQAPYSDKASAVESLRLPVDFAIVTSVLLEPIDSGLIDAARELNARSWNKRLQIGIGRPVAASQDASSPSLRWTPTSAGSVARWEITSPGARALRIGLAADRIQPGVEIRFAGRGQSGTVYGPFTAQDVIPGGATYWSPVLEGESAIVEVFIAWGQLPTDLALTITQVSHLFVSPSDPAAENIAKAAQPCEVDLICRSTSDAALANAGRSVAKMAFTDGAGTFLCTGTLLNPIGGSLTPYFYSANHCISTQASASTLTTHWFYDRTGCGTGGVSPNYVQLVGGATLLYADAFYDVLLLRLNGSPPGGAVFSGWDANALSAGTALTAVHHPVGDLKKVSLGTMGSFDSPSGSGPNFVVARWNSTATGVTEVGSSGSGIFTATGSEYRFRGGLYGGPSSCTASAANLYDYYSRLDLAYPAIAQYLNPGTVSCSYTLSAASVTVGANATTGVLSVTASSGCTWTATSDSPSWLTTSSSGSGGGTVAYSVAANPDPSRVGTITIAGHPFTVTQQAPVNPATNLVANPGFESGTTSWSQSATGGFPIIYTDDTGFAHSGSWYAWLGGYDSGTDTLYQEVTIPAGAAQAMLQFWYRIVTSEGATSTAYDTLTISIASSTTGARLATLATLSNSNQSAGWVQSQQYDVSAFTGQTVRLVFTVTTDSSNVTSFFVDDIALTAAVSSGAAPNYTALWWNAAESGWGINFNHQGNIVFATLFTYAASGNPMWLVMSAGVRQSGETFSGELYRTTGPAFNANPFDPSQVGVTSVGTMTVIFSGDTAVLSYSVNGINVNKSIQKQVYGARAATCQPTTSDRSSLANYQDLWWNTTESGWGVNVTHQDDILFATLFDYDATGQGLWLVMSGGLRQPDGSYLGDLFQTTGPAFNANPFTPLGPGNVRKVGTMQFRFTNGVTGTLTYSVDGINVTKSITRQLFSSPVPSCTS